MIPYLKEEWTKEPNLKHWLRQSTNQDQKCECMDGGDLVELMDHDSCYRGRIDTIVCVKCNKVKSFKIIR